MIKKPIKELEGKNIAIVAMGNSQLDYHKMITHSHEFDEVWAINAMIGVLKKMDRVFMLDPASRFFDGDDAGNMTDLMKNTLPVIEVPNYSCELDKRVPAIEEYPIDSIAKDLNCGYFNNTIAYAIAFALWNKVSGINMFGADFTYKTNMYFAESGRACCEFWLAKCMEAGITVQVALSSGLLDSDVSIKEKLYGYHRLDDPVITYVEDDQLKVCNWSEVEQQQAIPIGLIGRHNEPVEEGLIVEPKKY